MPARSDLRSVLVLSVSEAVDIGALSEGIRHGIAPKSYEQSC